MTLHPHDVARPCPARPAGTARAARRRVERLTRLALGALVLGCAHGARLAPPLPPESPGEGEVQSTLLLVGDAGEPGQGTLDHSEPVLRALRAEAARAPARTTIVYLGDNIYPDGAPPDSAAGGIDRAWRILDRQALGDSSRPFPAAVRRVFVPGNHDWNDHSGRPARDGAQRVREQERLLRRIDSAATARDPHHSRIVLSPPAGCPGPDVNDSLGPRLRLVALDTEWWLQQDSAATSRCTAADAAHDRAGALAALQRALSTAGGRHVVVVAHHPLASGGPHGGRCPLLNLSKECWKPKFNAFTRQDIPHPRNRAVRDTLTAVLRAHPPLLYAAGHEHTLQLVDGGGVGSAARFHAVSGAGIFRHSSPVVCTRGGIAAGSEAGFMRLDVMADGRARLTVLAVGADGVPTERARVWLTGGPAEGRNCS